MKRATTTDTGPLAGVQVLDLSAYIAGPYGCTLLADLGAEVVKIEPPEGDNLRKYPSTMVDHSRAFVGVNRGKRGVAINLKHPDGLELFRRMAEQADVVVHNFRPQSHRAWALTTRNSACAIHGLFTVLYQGTETVVRSGIVQVMTRCCKA